MRTKSQTSKHIIYSIIAVGLMITLLTSNVKFISAKPHQSNPGTTGLVAWWSMNENSGDRNDSHSTNHLDDINAPPSLPSGTGKQGNAVLYNGQNPSRPTTSLGVIDNPEISMGDIDFTIDKSKILNPSLFLVKN